MTPPTAAAGFTLPIEEVILVFDQPMDTRYWSILEASKTRFPPLRDFDGSPWLDERSFFLPLRPLRADTTYVIHYVIQLNSAARQGFRSASDGAPLAPARISFTTDGGIAPPEYSAKTSRVAVREPLEPIAEQRARRSSETHRRTGAEMASAPRPSSLHAGATCSILTARTSIRTSETCSTGPTGNAVRCDRGSLIEISKFFLSNLIDTHQFRVTHG